MLPGYFLLYSKLVNLTWPLYFAFASSVDELVAQTLELTIEEVNADRNVSNNAKNRQVVLNLYEKGIFDIKDIINQVAERLNISKHTVYLYISQFKSGDLVGHDR